MSQPYPSPPWLAQVSQRIFESGERRRAHPWSVTNEVPPRATPWATSCFRRPSESATSPRFGHGATGSGIERWAPPWAPSPAPGGCGMSERDQNSGTADCKPSDSAWKVGGRRSVAAPALVALVDGD